MSKTTRVNSAKCPHCSGTGYWVVVVSYDSRELESCILCSGSKLVPADLAVAYRLLSSSGVHFSDICDQLFKQAPNLFV
jgi:excinuclease UvrABC ATPase subunit